MSTLLLSSLGVVCPSCEQLNPPGTEKCQACHALTSGGAPAPAAKAAAPPPAAAKGPPPAVAPMKPAAGAAPVPTASKSGSDTVPPGLRPTARAAAKPPTPAPPQVAPLPPVPASDLVRKPTATALKAQGGPARTATNASVPVAVQAPAAGAPTGAAAAGAGKFSLTVLAGPARGQRFRLPQAGAGAGRTKGLMLFPEDHFVSPQHATFVTKESKLFVRDEASTSGVFVSIAQQETIPAHTFFNIGHRLFRYHGPIDKPAPTPGKPLAYGAPVPEGQALYALEEILVGGRPGRVMLINAPVFTMGQAMCDASFPAEEGIAPKHVELAPAVSGAVLKDISGGAGVFVKLRPGVERALKVGDRLRIGQQVLQVEGSA